MIETLSLSVISDVELKSVAATVPLTVSPVNVPSDVIFG